MSLRSLLLALMSLSLSAAAMAADPGVYLQLSGGYTVPDSDVELEDLEAENSGPLLDADLSLDDGYMAAVAVGYDFGNIRAEGEVSHRYNEWEDATIGGLSGFDTDGEFQALSVMANAIFEIPLGDEDAPVALYAGAGAGIAAIYLDGEYGPNDVEIGAGAIAYQGLAGVAFNLNDDITLNIGYRIWSCLDTDFDDDWDDDDDDDDDEEDLEGDLSVPFFHTVEIGLRYTF